MLYMYQLYLYKEVIWGLPGGSVVKNLPANAGDTGSVPDLGRSHMPQSNQAHVPQEEKPPQWEAYTSQLESMLCSRQPKLNKVI